MAKGTKITIDGIKEFKKLLDQLPKRIIKTHNRRAVSAAATVISKDAKKRAPKESGILKKSITRKIKSYPKDGNTIALIGANRDTVGEHEGRTRIPNKYLHLVTLGTKPHGYQTRPGQHPGAKANNFLDDAMEATQTQAINTAEQKLISGIQAEARKLAAKGKK